MHENRRHVRMSKTLPILSTKSADVNIPIVGIIISMLMKLYTSLL